AVHLGRHHQQRQRRRGRQHHDLVQHRIVSLIHCVFDSLDRQGSPASPEAGTRPSYDSLTRFILTGLGSGTDLPSTVNLVICQVMLSLSVLVTTLVAVTFWPAAVRAVVLTDHLSPSFDQTASPKPPPE